MRRLTQINKALLWIGIIEFMASASIFAFGIANVFFKSRLYYVGHGIWAGFIFMLASASALAAGCSKTRSYTIFHIVNSLVTCILTIPGLTTLLMIEKLNDGWYSYWTDPESCRTGCHSPESQYMQVASGNFFGMESTAGSYPCDSNEWKSECHSNAVAFYLETGALTILGLLSTLFIISASLACWSLCRWGKGGNVYPLSSADTVIVYTTCALPHYNWATRCGRSSATWSSPFGQDIIRNQQQPSAPPPSYEELQVQQPRVEQQQKHQHEEGKHN